MAGPVKPGKVRMMREERSMISKRTAILGSQPDGHEFLEIGWNPKSIYVTLNRDEYFTILEETTTRNYGWNDPERGWICLHPAKGKFVISHKDLVKFTKPGENKSRSEKKRKLSQARNLVSNLEKRLKKNEIQMRIWTQRVNDLKESLDIARRTLEKASEDLDKFDGPKTV